MVFLKNSVCFQVFSYEYCEIFKSKLFTEQLWKAASDSNDDIYPKHSSSIKQKDQGKSFFQVTLNALKHCDRCFFNRKPSKIYGGQPLIKWFDVVWSILNKTWKAILHKFHLSYFCIIYLIIVEKMIHESLGKKWSMLRPYQNKWTALYYKSTNRFLYGWNVTIKV